MEYDTLVATFFAGVSAGAGICGLLLLSLNRKAATFKLPPFKPEPFVPPVDTSTDTFIRED